MAISWLFLAVPLLIAGAILVWAVGFARRRQRSLVIDEGVYPGLVRLRSATLAARWTGLVLGGVAAVAMAFPGKLGRNVLAGLERRSWLDYPPRRPRNGADAELVQVDDVLRRMTAEGILAALGLAAGGTLLLVAGSAYPRFGSAACDTVSAASSYALAVFALAGLIIALRCVITIAVPGDGARR